MLDDKAMPGGKDKNPVGMALKHNPAFTPVFDNGGLALREEWGRCLPCNLVGSGPSSDQAAPLSPRERFANLMRDP